MAVKYKYLGGEFAADEKVPNQLKIIVEEFAKTEGFVDREAFLKVLNSEEVLPKFNTRQGVDRILAFYQKRLVDAGIIAIDKPAAAPKPKKEKTAKAKKTAVAGTDVALEDIDLEELNVE